MNQAPRNPQERGLAHSPNGTWIGLVYAHEVPDHAVSLAQDYQAWTEAHYVYTRNMSTAFTVAVWEHGPTPTRTPEPGTEPDATYVDPDQTRAPEPVTLDELVGAIQEAAEHDDWREVHAYALAVAMLAIGNVQ